MKSMLVIGLGRFGQHLASNLLDLGNDVMIIDSDERKLEGLVPYATSSKIGDCTNPEVLRSLGIGNFDVIFICIGTNFQSSLEITSLVKEMGGKHVVSKATQGYPGKIPAAQRRGRGYLSGKGYCRALCGQVQHG